MSRSTNNRTGRKQSNSKSGKKGYNSRTAKPTTNKPSDEDTSKKSSNDPKWYGSDYAILRDSASINYSIPSGSILREMKLGYQAAIQQAFPGLYSLYACSGIGYSDDPSAPINVAANSIYSYVRHANSGHSNYDAPDLMIYLIAMSQVYAYINFLTRAYAVSTLYGQKNRYLPDALMWSMSIDPNDAQVNGAKFRYGINVLVNKAASFAVPNNMPYFAREAFLYSGIYTEGSSIKDQLYIINPQAFLKYQLDSDEHYGCLDYVEYRKDDNHIYSVDELIAFGNSLLDPIIQSEDMNIMSGDILKAYGQDQLIKLSSVSEATYVVPEFNITVLEQIKNARIIGRPDFIGFGGPGSMDGSSKHVVDQASSQLHPYLISRPHVQISQYNIPDEAIARTCLVENPIVLTTTTPDPDVDVTIENTRFAVPFVEDGSKYRVYYASDYITDASVFTAFFNQDTGSYYYDINHMSFINTTDLSGQYTGGVIHTWHRFGTLCHFDFAPLMYEIVIYKNPGDTEGQYYLELVGDTDNFALVQPDTIIRMNEAAMLNLLHVDTIAKLG
nr:putative capsid [Marmot picobirnavirus]